MDSVENDRRWAPNEWKTQYFCLGVKCAGQFIRPLERKSVSNLAPWRELQFRARRLS